MCVCVLLGLNEHNSVSWIVLKNYAHLKQHKVERDCIRLLIDDVHAPCR
jgi:hypothetical protein